MVRLHGTAGEKLLRFRRRARTETGRRAVVVFLVKVLRRPGLLLALLAEEPLASAGRDRVLAAVLLDDLLQWRLTVNARRRGVERRFVVVGVMVCACAVHRHGVHVVQVVSFRLLAEVQTAAAGALVPGLVPRRGHVSSLHVPDKSVSRFGPVQLVGHVRVEVVVRLLGHEVVEDDQEDADHQAEDAREQQLAPKVRRLAVGRDVVVGRRQQGGHDQEAAEHEENDADVQHADAAHHFGVYGLIAFAVSVEADYAVARRQPVRVAVVRVRAVAAFARLLLLLPTLALALDRQRGVQAHGVHREICEK